MTRLLLSAFLLVLSTLVVSAQQEIDVTFHVLTFDDGSGDVPDALLTAQLDSLNVRFAPTEYQFRLASIVRTANSTWANFGYDADFAQVGAALAIDPAQRMNVYYYPNTTDGAIGHVVEVGRWQPSDTRNGIFVHQGTLPGGQYALFNEGYFLPGLAGAYLGLQFIFPGCSENDGVADTPRFSEFEFGCPEAAALGACSGDSQPLEVLADNMMRLGNQDACTLTLTDGQSSYLTSRIQQFWPDLGMPVAGEAGPAGSGLAIGAPWPNPTAGRASVRVEGLTSLGRAVLMDARGRVVGTYSLEPGQQDLDLDTSDLAPGLYALTVQADGRTQVRLLTVAR